MNVFDSRLDNIRIYSKKANDSGILEEIWSLMTGEGKKVENFQIEQLNFVHSMKKYQMYDVYLIRIFRKKAFKNIYVGQRERRAKNKRHSECKWRKKHHDCTISTLTRIPSLQKNFSPFLDFCGKPTSKPYKY